MKKLLRLLLRLFLFSLVILAGIFTLNTIGFTSKQVKVEPVQKMEISEKVVSRLSKALQCPTVSYNHKIDTAAFLNLDTLLQASFPLVDSFLERETVNKYSFIYKWQGRNTKLSPILLMGHLDVVPVEESRLSDWEAPPFSGKIIDGNIYGRGTLDDKMSVMGLLEAVEILLKENYTPNRTVYLAFGHDEEVSGKNGAGAIAEKFKERKIDFEYVLDEGGMTLNNAMPGLDAPLAMIGIAEKGYVTLSLTAQLQNGGHSSMPPSQTAIGMLSEAIHKLQQNPFPAKIDGAVGALLNHVGPEMNLFNKVIFANSWLTEDLLIGQFSKSGSANALIRTTVAPTMLRGGFKENVLPTKASAKINFRILPGETTQSVLEYVRDVIDNEQVVVQFSEDSVKENPSPVSSTESFGFETIQATIQQLNPEAVVSPSLVIAQTDSRHFSKVAKDVYRYSPLTLNQEDLSRFHGLNERIEVEQYKNMIRFYRQLIMNSCR